MLLCGKGFDQGLNGVISQPALGLKPANFWSEIQSPRLQRRNPLTICHLWPPKGQDPHDLIIDKKKKQSLLAYDSPQI